MDNPTYLNVYLRGGFVYEIQDAAEIRDALNAALDGRFPMTSLHLPMVRGEVMRCRADDITSWGPNTPEGRAAQRAFAEALDAEEEPTPEWQQ